MSKQLNLFILAFAFVAILSNCGGGNKSNQTKGLSDTTNTEEQSKSSGELGLSDEQVSGGNSEKEQKITEVIQTYCNYFNQAKYKQIEALFATDVQQYINLKNTKATTIAIEAERFLTTKKNVDYFADFNELRVNGKTAVVPLNIQWSGYATRVLTEIKFNDAYRIVSFKETKVLRQRYSSTLKTTKKQIVKAYQNCDYKNKKGDCTYFLFDYMLVDQAPNEQIKQVINNQVMKSLMSSTGTNVRTPTEADLRKAARDLVSSFDEAVKSHTVASAFYTNASASIKQIGNLVTINSFSEGYTGGAHGYSLIEIIHYDLNTGKEIKLEDVLTPGYLPVLQKMGTQIVKKMHSIPADKTLKDVGYTIGDNEDFKLSQNYLFKGDHIEFRYNRYEAGPYVLTPPWFTVKYADIKRFIKKDGLLAGKIK